MPEKQLDRSSPAGRISLLKMKNQTMNQTMNTSINNPKSNCLIRRSDDVAQSTAKLSALHNRPGPFNIAALLAGILLALCGTLPAFGHESPPGCRGSGLGISLFTDVLDAHVGDTIRYSAQVFNTAFPACDATAIVAGIVTP